MKMDIPKKFFCIILPLFFSCGSETTQPLTDFDYDEIRNLKLKGVVTGVETPTFPAFHGYGVIYVDVLKSNIKSYDPRPDKNRYLLILKDDKAEIYEQSDLINIGDTINLNIPEMEISYYSSELNKEISSTPQIYDQSLFNYINEKGLQKL